MILKVVFCNFLNRYVLISIGMQIVADNFQYVLELPKIPEVAFGTKIVRRSTLWPNEPRESTASFWSVPSFSSLNKEVMTIPRILIQISKANNEVNLKSLSNKDVDIDLVLEMLEALTVA